MKTHPNNSIIHYFTALPEHVRLGPGDLECGLCEIHYPRSWYNVQNGDFEVHMNIYTPHSRVVNLHVESGIYLDPVSLVNEMKRAMAIDWKQEIPLAIDYDPFLKKKTIILKPNTRIVFSQCLQNIFGYYERKIENQSPKEQIVSSDMPADTERGINGLYVYTDVIHPRILGDTKVRLLHVVPVKGKHGEMVCIEYQSIHYIDVLNKEFDTNILYITDDAGEEVPFKSGRVVVSLHFRSK